jgi:excisionase family DNA binding protein
MTRELPELMATLDEVAAAMKVSKSTVKRLIAEGTLPSVLIGRCRRVRWRDLEEHIANLPVAVAS